MSEDVSQQRDNTQKHSVPVILTKYKEVKQKSTAILKSKHFLRFTFLRLEKSDYFIYLYSKM